MKQNNQVFIYDNIYFESGKKDEAEHPIIVAGMDDTNLYCFMMTSKTKHINKNSHERNMYNENVKYVKTTPGKNCTVKNNLPGLINTSFCFAVPKDIAAGYDNFGVISTSLAREVIAKWAYQQNEIKDKKDWNYDQLCAAFGIDDITIKNTETYKYCVALMSNFKKEVENQRKYAKELREYREARYKISKENKLRKANNLPTLSYPKEPRLADDKDYLKQYMSAPSEPNNPFAELSKQLFGEESSTPATQIEIEKHQTQSTSIEELKEYKEQIQRLQSYNQANNFYGQDEYYEEEQHHRRAA